MGGNLLSSWNLPAKRLPLKEYDKLRIEFINEFRSVRNSFELLRGPRVYIQEIPYVGDKEDFGDCDLMVSGSSGQSSITASVVCDIVKTLTPFVKANGNIVSCAYKGFQFDLILQESAMHRAWLSYNDLGHLISKLFNRVGLGLGIRGLTITYTLADLLGLQQPNWKYAYVFKKYVVSVDWNTILSAAGLSMKTWTKGFANKQAMYDFIISSHLFHPDAYRLPERGAKITEGTKKSKRSTYQGFLKYMDELEAEGRLPKKNLDLGDAKLLHWKAAAPDSWGFQWNELTRTVSEVLLQDALDNKVKLTDCVEAEAYHPTKAKVAAALRNMRAEDGAEYLTRDVRTIIQDVKNMA